MSMSKSWKKLGLDSEGSVQSLMYSELTRKIIINVTDELDGLFLNSLYIRNRSDNKYVKVQGKCSEYSFHDPLLMPDGKSLLTNIFRAEKRDGLCEYNWESLSLISITELGHQDTIVSKKGSVILIEDAWISKLYNLSNDGFKVYCSIAYPIDEGGKITTIEYWLCELFLNNVTINKITRLNGVFF